MSDTLYDGRRFRTLNVLDEGNREALAVEVATSIPGRHVVAVLDQLVAIHGAPRALRCDNGPELISAALEDWAERGLGGAACRGAPAHPAGEAGVLMRARPDLREYMEREIPHLWSLMRASTAEVGADADVVVVGNSAREFREIGERLDDSR
jgi:transposase InsO family protein